MMGQAGAIMRRGPRRGVATTEVGSNLIVTAAAAGASQQLNNQSRLGFAGGVNGVGGWLTIRVSVDTCIALSATAVNGATTDYFMPAGSEEEFYAVMPEDAYLCYIRAASAAADGAIHIFRSDR
jgi:hypothetical protein